MDARLPSASGNSSIGSASSNSPNTMSIGAQVTYLGNALQQRLATLLVWLADAIAFLSRTVWPVADVLIRIWIGRQALVLSVLTSTNWAMAVSMAAGSYPIPVSGIGS